MTEIILDSAAFDRLLADLEPKECPECGSMPGNRHGYWSTACDKDAKVRAGVAVIPLEEEPTEECDVCLGTGHEWDPDLSSFFNCGHCNGTKRVPVRSLTIREADQPDPWPKIRETVPAWIDDVVPYRGDCGICGCNDARHRVLDGIAERVRSGEGAEAVAADYDYPEAFCQRLADEWDREPREVSVRLVGWENGQAEVSMDNPYRETT